MGSAQSIQDLDEGRAMNSLPGPLAASLRAIVELVEQIERAQKSISKM